MIKKVNITGPGPINEYLAVYYISTNFHPEQGIVIYKKRPIDMDEFADWLIKNYSQNIFQGRQPLDFQFESDYEIKIILKTNEPGKWTCCECGETFDENDETENEKKTRMQKEEDDLAKRFGLEPEEVDFNGFLLCDKCYKKIIKELEKIKK